MLHLVKNFEYLLDGTAGFSHRQVSQHLAVYAGLVGKLNEIEVKLAHADRGAANAAYNDYSELKRREAVAFNGAYLHELYFEGLGNTPLIEAGPLAGAIAKDFGSLLEWERDFRAAATSTTGWVLLTHNRMDGRLHHYVLSDYHIGLPILQTVILAIDCWEHAFLLDFGMAKQDYLTTVLKHLNWSVAEARLQGKNRFTTILEPSP